MVIKIVAFYVRGRANYQFDIKTLTRVIDTSTFKTFSTYWWELKTNINKLNKFDLSWPKIKIKERYSK